jgi:hypothetical protein
VPLPVLTPPITAPPRLAPWDPELNLSLVPDPYWDGLISMTNYPESGGGGYQGPPASLLRSRPDCRLLEQFQYGLLRAVRLRQG